MKDLFNRLSLWYIWLYGSWNLLSYLHRKSWNNYNLICISKCIGFLLLSRATKIFYPQVLFNFFYLMYFSVFLQSVMSSWSSFLCCLVLLSGTDFLDMCLTLLCMVYNMYGYAIEKLSSVTYVVIVQNDFIRTDLSNWWLHWRGKIIQLYQNAFNKKQLFKPVLNDIIKRFLE